MLESTVCPFDLNIPYDEWVRKFDNHEAPARTAKGIKEIFRGVSKDNPKKAILVSSSSLRECLRETYTREY